MRQKLNNLPKVTELVITRTQIQHPGQFDSKDYSINYRSILLLNVQCRNSPQLCLTPDLIFNLICYVAPPVWNVAPKNDTK